MRWLIIILPDTDILVLIGQMFAVSSVVVEALDSSCVGTEEVLGAALGRQVGKARGVLTHLKERRKDERKGERHDRAMIQGVRYISLSDS